MVESDVLSAASFIRYYPLIVSSGTGSRLFDTSGREFIDFSSGGSVANLGYCHPTVMRAIESQLHAVNHVCLPVASSDVVTKACEQLLGFLELRGAKVWFGCSGSDASDWVFKIVPKATGRPKIVTFIGAYHGQTAGASSLSGLQGQSRFSYSGDVVKAPYPYCYRCPLGHQRSSCGLDCFSYLADYLASSVFVPEDVAAVYVEPYQVDGGVVVPPREFMSRLQAFTRAHGMLLIVDEVLTGFFRTGTRMGADQFGLEPDALVIGKSIGAGIPLSAVVGKADLMDALPISYLLTTGGSVLGCSALVASLEVLADLGFAVGVNHRGALLETGLRELSGRHACVGDVRGSGMLYGLEIVDLSGAPDQTTAHKLCFSAWRNGLVIYYLGLYSNVLIVSPPLTSSEEDLKCGLEALGQAFADVEAGRVADADIKGYRSW